MKQEVKIGQTDYSVLVLIRNTAGAPKTGLTNASAGIDVCYTRVETDNDVVLTDGALVALATPALTDVHLDWGFLEVSATKAPGLYRLDIADGVFVTGAWSAVVSLVGTDLDSVHLEFMLVPVDPYTGVNISTIGGTAQTSNDNGADINDILTDTAVIGALGAGLTALADKTTLDLIHTDVDAVLADTGTDGVVLKAAGLAADAVDEILDEVVEGTITLRQAMRIFLSALAGKSAGGGTVTLTFQNNADTAPRITATVDANGNRTAMTLDGA